MFRCNHDDNTNFMHWNDLSIPPHSLTRRWGRSSADLLWKLSSHLGRVDSDGLASAQRRPALWVSSLLQEKQGSDALKCGSFQSLSDSSSRWVMTCEIHGTKMTQSCCVSTGSLSMAGHQSVRFGIFCELVTIWCPNTIF